MSVDDATTALEQAQARHEEALSTLTKLRQRETELAVEADRSHLVSLQSLHEAQLAHQNAGVFVRNAGLDNALQASIEKSNRDADAASQSHLYLMICRQDIEEAQAKLSKAEAELAAAEIAARTN